MQGFVTFLEKTVPHRLQRKFIEQVAQNLPDIIYVLDLEERKVIFINDRVSIILGQTPQQIYSQGSLFFLKKLHPDDYLSRMEHFTACRDMKDNEMRNIDVRFKVKDGTWRWFRIRDIPFQFKHGKVSQTIGVARDIHELKFAEERLRKQELLLRTAINLIPNPLQAFKSVRDEKGAIIDFEWLIVNEASTEYTNDVVGKSLIQRYPGVLASGLFSNYIKVVETGQPFREKLYYGYDGVNKWIDFYAAKMNDGFVVLIYELSDEVKKE